MAKLDYFGTCVEQREGDGVQFCYVPVPYFNVSGCCNNFSPNSLKVEVSTQGPIMASSYVKRYSSRSFSQDKREKNYFL